MKDHYDFENMKSRKNPYAKLLWQSVTIRLDNEALAYFKALAGETGIPYQKLMSLYLRECAEQKKRPKVEWTT